MNSDKYIQLLKNHLIQDLDERKTFQHVTDCVQHNRVKFYEGFSVLKDFQAQNTDLNIIEHMNRTKEKSSSEEHTI